MYGGHRICGAAGGGEGERRDEDGPAPAPAPAPAPVPAPAPAPAPGEMDPNQPNGDERLCASCRSMTCVNGCRFHGGVGGEGEYVLVCVARWE